MRMACGAAALLVGISASLCSAPAATYHVAPGGNDGHPGTSAQPWRTLGRANAMLCAGDTVLIHAGVYDDQIRPARSGTSDAERIVYRAAGDGNVVLNRYVWSADQPANGLVALGQRNYVTVSGRPPGGGDSDRFLRVCPVNGKVELYGNFTGSTGCVVENAVMERGNAQSVPNRGWVFSDYWYKHRYESKYNVLRNCVIRGYSRGATGAEFTEDTVNLAQDAHHNLVENCYIGACRHTSLNQNQGTTHTNVLRNNVVENPDHTAMALYGLAETQYRQDRHLIEGNTLRASGKTHSPSAGAGSSLQFAAAETIVRFNVVTESGAADQSFSSLAAVGLCCGANAPVAADNRFYNNTVVCNRVKAVGSHRFDGGARLGRSRFWNNFFYDSQRPDGNRWLVEYWRGMDDGLDRYVRNVFGNPGGSPQQEIMNVGRGAVSLAAARNYRSPNDPEFSDWNGYSNVYDADLNDNTFRDYAGKDYALKKSSPYVDAGAPLTRVAPSDSGAGASLCVEDSRCFYSEAREFPAWMGVRNDWIAVGPAPATAAKLQIAAVDDSSGTLMLAAPIARRRGDYVWLWADSSGRQVIKGKAPDIGAFESDADSAAPLPADPSRGQIPFPQ
jgi:hypothetical protein